MDRAHVSRASRRRQTGWAWVVAAAMLVLVAAGCGSSDDSSAATEGTTASGELATADTLRLGYFANVTHAPAIVGVEEGIIAEAIAPTKLEVTTFNAGPSAIEAMLADAIDATFIGPNPAINGFAKSNGELLRIVSGSTSGGAFLVVKPEINSVEDLRGKKLATPQLGNTQDVALRAWLKENGLETDTAGGGDVSIQPQENADTLTTFKDGQIDGAWVPEPWATRLVQEGGGKVLIDEATLWPEGKFVTTHLIVRTEFLEKYPGTVKQLLEGELDALELIDNEPDRAKTITNQGIEKVTQKALPQQVIDAAWENLQFTYDPVASSLAESAKDAAEVGVSEEVDLDGIYELTLLNELLAERNQPAVSGL